MRVRRLRQSTKPAPHSHNSSRGAIADTGRGRGRGGGAAMRHTLCILALLTSTATSASGVRATGSTSRQGPPTSTTTTITDQTHPEDALRWGRQIFERFWQDDKATALEEFDHLASESGFSIGDTLFQLGRAHDEGRPDIGIKRDEGAARQLYAKGAELGHPASQHALAAVLASSADTGGEVEAVLYDFFASLGGEPLAHAALGYRYLHGIGTIQNCAQSLKHYEVAARETIADLYSEGRGGISRPVDLTRLADRFMFGRRPVADAEAEAADYWLSSAEAGDVVSMRAMGVLYHHGTRGVEQNLTAAYNWFKQAAEHDRVSAAMAGDMLLRGAGVKVDYSAALSLFRKSRQEAVAMNGLGYLFYHGLAGVPQDFPRALECFEMAQSQDKDKNVNILFNLGLLFKGDKLVDKRGKPLGFEVTNSAGEKSVLKKDLVKARSYFEAAATRGHVEAAFQAAHLYAQSEPLSVGECQFAVQFLKMVVEKGPWMRGMQEALNRYVEGDHGGALVLYSRLAEIGFEVAQSNAAWLLDSAHCGEGSGGIEAISHGSEAHNGTSPEVVCQKRALRMYEHAARQGRAAAEVKVGDFHYFGKAGFPVDHEKAAKRYLKASDARDAEGLFSMGFMHQTGRGVPQDLFLAKRYFDYAAAASTDAIPVARLSLLSLRAQGTLMRWRDWWREIVGEPYKNIDASSSGEASDAHVNAHKVMSSEETLALAALMVLLVAVLGERARRGWERRRLAGEETV